MKITAFILFFSSIAFGQEFKNQSIGDLQKRATRLKTEIKIKSDSLSVIENKIENLQYQEYLIKVKPKGGGLVMTASIKMEGNLRKSSSPLSDIIIKINKNDTVKLTDYQNGYWIVNTNQYFGYLSDLYINETEEIKKFNEELMKLNEEFRIKKEKEEAKKQTAIQKQKDNEYRQKIFKQFGQKTGQKLLDGYYWIGMTDKMAKISLGEPRSINQTVGAWGVHEQWVYYDSIYLYFENNILTNYQNLR